MKLAGSRISNLKIDIGAAGDRTDRSLNFQHLCTGRVANFEDWVAGVPLLLDGANHLSAGGDFHLLKLTGAVAGATSARALEGANETRHFRTLVVRDRHFEGAKRTTTLTSATVVFLCCEEHLLTHAVQNLSNCYRHCYQCQDMKTLVRIF